MMLLYSLALVVAIVIASPYWLFRMAWSGRYRHGLGQRLGLISPGLRKFVGDHSTIWIHAVSVGEVIAASRLIERIQTLDPDLRMVISTTTKTGQQLAQQRFDAVPQQINDSEPVPTRVFYYPLDFAWIVRRYFKALKPRALVLVESELWPRMLVEAERTGVPVIVVNGRISNRSLPRYSVLRSLWAPLLRKLTLVLAQSEEDQLRFVHIGVPAEKVRSAGNLKYDVRAAAELPVTCELRTLLPKSGKVIVAGSTLEGEERLLLNAFRELLPDIPQLTMILAPRHPERFRSVEKLITDAGLPLIRRSDWMQQPEPIAAGSVFLLDTVGELASVYSLASAAFVGGSLIPAGGHNPLEPAQFAVPIVMGPYTENFRGMVAALLEQEAIRVTPPERFCPAMRELLTSAQAESMGTRARHVFEEQSGASEMCLAAIQKILARSSPASNEAVQG
ncbi:MAG TPA: 3-deoxy-D-manno-octulosonic acid transferase [Acidobacteriaceae bacterium]|nr:3-deoxy-D-manno-octulosonic acid transferase [Acidobacteriaceae bacterium]